MNDSPQKAGAIARSKSLSKTDRSAIARRAAIARHSKGLPKAVAEGHLKIGDLMLPCAVLDDADNTRVLSQSAFLAALGRSRQPNAGSGATIAGMPPFLRASNLEPFIPNDLVPSTSPIEFIPLKGPGYEGRVFGYRATLLPGVCWVYQDAMVAGKLHATQMHVGEACKAFLKALTNHAIEDLIDDATGFADLKKRRAIDKIIEKFCRPDALPWVKMFDIDFYRHIYRLNDWDFDPAKTARPGVIGHWTNDIYDRLAPGITGALHQRVKRNSHGKPTQKLTQYLTTDEGKPRMRELLEGVKVVMRLSTTWDEFMLKLNTIYPRLNDTLQLPFEQTQQLPAPTSSTASLPRS